MSPLELARRGMRRLKFVFGKRDAEREMNEEMRIHLEFEIDDRMKRGMSAAEARRTALVDFGGVERFKEEARVARGVRGLEELTQDISYAFRVLRKSPAFSITTILTVSIGIAATTTAFSVVNSVLLKDPPVADANRLYTIAEVWKSGMRSTQTDMAQYMYPFAHLVALRRANGAVMSGMAGYRYGNVALREGNSARPLNSMAVSANFFAVLGVTPALGRLFSDTVDHTGVALDEIVLSYDFWQRELAGAGDVLGRMMYVDGRAVTVVGVAARNFRGPIVGLSADIWVPTNTGSVTMIGRLNTGASREQAISALTTAAREIVASEPSMQVVRITVDQMKSVPAMVRNSAIGGLGMFMLMSAIVLLIVATNVAGMFLARAAHRRREIAVRLSLGAGRGRIIRQLLTETLALSLVGGAIGVLLARALLQLSMTVEIPGPARIVLDLAVDRTVLSIAFGVTLLTGVVAGLAPALQSARLDLLSGLRADGGVSRGPTGRTRRAFVVVQLAMSLVLLVSAGLFTRALYRAVHTHPGFDTDRVVTGKVNLSGSAYDVERSRDFYTRLSQELRARPEFEEVSLAEWTPLAFGQNSEEIQRAEGGREPVQWGVADPHYAETMRIGLVAGRMFNDADTPQSMPVIVVNETLANRMWPSQSPIGQTLRLYGERTVVGVMRDGKYRNLDEAAHSYAFLPVAQRFSRHLTVFARARSDRAAAIRALRSEVSAIDPNISVEKAGLLSDELEIHYLPQKIAAWCIGIFGIIGLGLASLGVYGLVAYQVSQRTREFGIRMALGACRRDILTSVLHSGGWLTLTAIAIGIPLAFAVGVLVRSQIYGVGAADPLTFGCASALFAGVVLLASYVPARRASRVDPVVSLRVE